MLAVILASGITFLSAAPTARHAGKTNYNAVTTYLCQDNNLQYNNLLNAVLNRETVQLPNFPELRAWIQGFKSKKETKPNVCNAGFSKITFFLVNFLIVSDDDDLWSYNILCINEWVFGHVDAKEWKLKQYIHHPCSVKFSGVLSIWLISEPKNTLENVNIISTVSQRHPDDPCPWTYISNGD